MYSCLNLLLFFRCWPVLIRLLGGVLIGTNAELLYDFVFASDPINSTLDLVNELLRDVYRAFSDVCTLLFDLIDLSFYYRVILAISPRTSLCPLGRYCSWLRILTFLPMRLSVMRFPQSM